MAKKNVYDQVVAIITSNRGFREKEQLLSAIELDGKPGCVKARKAIGQYYSRKADKVRAYKQRSAANNPVVAEWRISFSIYYDDAVFDFVESRLEAAFPVLGASGIIDRMPAEIKYIYRQIDNIIGSSRTSDYRQEYRAFGNVRIPDKDLKEAIIRLHRIGKRLGRMMNEVNKLNDWYKDYKEAELRRRKEQEAEVLRKAEADNAFHKKWGVSEDRVKSVFNASKDYACIVGPYTFEAEEDIEKDWNYYAKSYGFPKVTVTGRFVNVYKNGKRIDKIELDAFRGNWMIDTIAKVLNIQAPKVEKSLRKLQITKWTDVKPSVKRDGFQTYKLLLGKYVVGYVAYDNQHDIHYHDDTLEASISGLKDKITKFIAEEKAKEAGLSKTWTAQQLNSTFGFCWPGMTEFAAACGIDRDKEYTVQQLRNAIKGITDESVLRKYRRELLTINVLTR